MKKVFYPLACLAAGALVACGGQRNQEVLRPINPMK